MVRTSTSKAIRTDEDVASGHAAVVEERLHTPSFRHLVVREAMAPPNIKSGEQVLPVLSPIHAYECPRPPILALFCHDGLARVGVKQVCADKHSATGAQLPWQDGCSSPAVSGSGWPADTLTDSRDGASFGIMCRRCGMILRGRGCSVEHDTPIYLKTIIPPLKRHCPSLYPRLRSLITLK